MSMLKLNSEAGQKELSNALEASVNLVYLIRLDRSDPGKVLEWAEMASVQLQRIANLIAAENN